MRCIVLLICVVASYADVTVYLDRPGFETERGYPLQEPAFNPKVAIASPGESVHFVARFRNITSDFNAAANVPDPNLSSVRLKNSDPDVLPIHLGFCRVGLCHTVRLQ